MHFLYRLSDGTEQTPPYGLTLARLVPLPPSVLEKATRVSRALTEREARKKRSRAAALVQKRRRLVLDLREQLEQAKQSSMGNDTLMKWLRELQKDFVHKMLAVHEIGKDIQRNADDEGLSSNLISSGAELPRPSARDDSESLSSLELPANNIQRSPYMAGALIRDEIRSPTSTAGTSISCKSSQRFGETPPDEMLLSAHASYT